MTHDMRPFHRICHLQYGRVLIEWPVISFRSSLHLTLSLLDPLFIGSLKVPWMMIFFSRTKVLKLSLCWSILVVNNNNNDNVIYIASFTMCSRRLEESRKKMRFKFVFEPVHMIDSTDTARQPIPKMRPSHRKGTIARLFFGARDLKCNGQIRTETVFSFVDTRLKIWRQITRRTKMESFDYLPMKDLCSLVKWSDHGSKQLSPESAIRNTNAFMTHISLWLGWCFYLSRYLKVLKQLSWPVVTWYQQSFHHAW